MPKEVVLILEELAKKYPNDYELGQKIRALISSDFFKKEVDDIKKPLKN